MALDAIVLGLIVLVAIALLAGCTASARPAPPSVPTLADARTLLAAHAKALLERDPAGYDAGLDPSAPAARYRAAQLDDFADLARVPLAQWTYSVLGAVGDATAIGQERARYGVPVLIVDATLGYRLSGIDTLPDTHDQYLTLTRRGGAVYLAGDDALAAMSSPSWDGPWQYGPLAAARGRSSLVLGPPAQLALLREIASDADAAVQAVTKVWGDRWAREAAIILAPTAAAFGALSGGGLVEDSATADIGTIDPVTQRAVGQRVYLNPVELPTLSALGRAIVLRHEITHLASAAATSELSPRWLVEGLAEYVANLGTGQSARQTASELAEQVAAGRLPSALPDASAFAGDPATAYEQSWLACRLIAQTVGAAGLTRFYRAVGTASEPAAPALAAAFASVLHETQATFTARWRRYVKAVLK